MIAKVKPKLAEKVAEPVAPDPPAPSPTAAWRSTTTSVLQVLRSCVDLLANPPPGGSPQERLDDLLAVAEQLDLRHDGLDDPAREAAARWGRRAGGGSFVNEEVEVRVLLLARSIITAVGDCLDAGATSAKVVSAKAFGTGTRTVPSGWREPDGYAPIVYLVGNVAALPDDHPLRAQLVGVDLFLSGGLEPSLVLGLTGRRWYSIPEALNLTKFHRDVQRREEEERAEEVRRELRNRAAEFRTSELGQLRAKQRALAEMEARGLIPPGADDYEPAVRSDN